MGSLVFTDGDGGSCRSTHTSTTGGVLLVSGRIAKTWSSTRGQVARSSAEAAVYEIVQAGRDGLSVRQLLPDLGWARVSVVIRSDASVACGTIARHGAGVMKHVSVRDMWIRESLRSCEYSPGNQRSGRADISSVCACLWTIIGPTWLAPGASSVSRLVGRARAERRVMNRVQTWHSSRPGTGASVGSRTRTWCSRLGACGKRPLSLSHSECVRGPDGPARLGA